MRSAQQFVFFLVPLMVCARVSGQPDNEMPGQRAKRALLAFRATTSASEREHPTFLSWAEATEVCDAATWNSRRMGWEEVMCDGGCSQCHVVFLNLHDVGAGGDMNELVPLTELRVLTLNPSSTVTGSLSTLVGMTQLRRLDLHNTGVHGALSSLFGLTHLGESWIAPDGLRYNEGVLYLAGTKAYGAAHPLRTALPALHEWSPERDPYDYTACSGYPGQDTCSGSGLPMVADAFEHVGIDECACCDRTTKKRDNATGACVGLESEVQSQPTSQPVVDSSNAVSNLEIGMVGFGLVVVCGLVCLRGQKRDGLFEHLLGKMAKGGPKYDTSEVKLSVPGAMQSDNKVAAP